MPCLSPSPSRGRPGWGWVLPGLEGNPSPPNPPLEGEGFNMCHGFFAISEITSKCGGRFSRVTVSEVCTARPALSAHLRRDRAHTSELQSLMRNSYDVFCWN